MKEDKKTGYNAKTQTDKNIAWFLPNPNPEKYEVVKRVFIGNRTMHLPRVCIVFRKKVD